MAAIANSSRERSKEKGQLGPRVVATWLEGSFVCLHSKRFRSFLLLLSYCSSTTNVCLFDHKHYEGAMRDARCRNIERTVRYSTHRIVLASESRG